MKKTISGIRGVPGADLNLKDIIGFCNGFSKLVEDRCILARDTRTSGDMISRMAAAALIQNGIDVLDLGISPTPVAFRESRQINAALCVTASHNPLHWNGLKFSLYGRGVNSRQMDAILHSPEARRGSIGSRIPAKSSYVEDIMDLVGYIDYAPKILVDVGGGAAAGIASHILKEMGCSVSVINQDPAESTRGPDPTSDSLDDLVARTKTAEIGFAFDLDGDRLVLVRDGKKLSPDTTLALGVSKAIDMGYSRYVLSIDTSVSIERMIKENGGSVIRSKVGEANVVDTMLMAGAEVGGEGSSGGFILPEFNMCRDGILAGCFIASTLRRPDLDQVISLVESYDRVRDAVPLATSMHDAALQRAAEWIKDECSDTVEIDGIKGIIDEDAWVLVRPSNTEDVIRISAESDKPGGARQIVRNVRAAMVE